LTNQQSPTKIGETSPLKYVESPEKAKEVTEGKYQR